MDTTLRDGEQMSGVSFSASEKLTIAQMLITELMVDRLEVASARVSDGEFQAVKRIAGRCDAMLVIGAPNSSNSLRLVEVAERNGVRAKLIQRAEEIDFDWLGAPATLGITAGASAPEILVREVVDALATRFTVSETVVEAAIESIEFKLPRGLAA